jgi:MFS family permease
MDATFREWAAGREWAVEIFGGLCAVAIGLTLIRKLLDNQNDSSRKKPSPSDTAQAARFASFQRSYLTVYVIVMLADWMQGTHMYTLYKEYAQQEGSNVQIGTLFFTGFMAAGVLGTFTGPLVDRYGRKRACLVYAALEVVINLLEHVNSFPLLLLGRVLGGISTSLLFSAFEAVSVASLASSVQGPSKPAHIRATATSRCVPALCGRMS